MIRSRPRRGLLFASLAIAGALTAQDKKPAPTPPTPEQALAKAQKHHRRALLTFLATDDARSAALAQAFKERELSHLLLYEFAQSEVRPLDRAHEQLDLAAKYGVAADAAAMPALVVLDADGKKLAAFGPKDLFTDGDAIQARTLTAALTKLACEPLDGEQVLTAALASAKKADKRLLLTFDAPW